MSGKVFKSREGMAILCKIIDNILDKNRRVSGGGDSPSLCHITFPQVDAKLLQGLLLDEGEQSFTSLVARNVLALNFDGSKGKD